MKLAKTSPLDKANEKLLEILSKLQELTPKLQKLEVEYQQRFSQLTIASGMANQALREAEAREAMRVEGSSEAYLTMMVDFKNLLSAKEIWIEVSRNLRVIEMSRSKYLIQSD